MVVHTCDPRTEAEGLLQVPGQTELHCELKVSPSCTVRPCLKHTHRESVHSPGCTSRSFQSPPHCSVSFCLLEPECHYRGGSSALCGPHSILCWGAGSFQQCPCCPQPGLWALVTGSVCLWLLLLSTLCLDGLHSSHSPQSAPQMAWEGLG